MTHSDHFMSSRGFIFCFLFLISSDPPIPFISISLAPSLSAVQRVYSCFSPSCLSLFNCSLKCLLSSLQITLCNQRAKQFCVLLILCKCTHALIQRHTHSDRRTTTSHLLDSVFLYLQFSSSLIK